MASLQRVQAAKPPAYMLENGPMQLSFDEGNDIEADFKLICSQQGDPVLLDAARFGAYAYRLRNWWCNWLPPSEHVWGMLIGCVLCRLCMMRVECVEYA